jgi:hypothetical protein
VVGFEAPSGGVPERIGTRARNSGYTGSNPVAPYPLKRAPPANKVSTGSRGADIVARYLEDGQPFALRQMDGRTVLACGAHLETGT